MRKIVIAALLAGAGTAAYLRAEPPTPPPPLPPAPVLRFDPTKARYFTEFNSAPGPKMLRTDDLRLNAAELDRFRQNGFVVSERLGEPSFGMLFYKIFRRDLPVYVSADAALHAWHYSYDGLLKELEQTYLAPSLGEVLSAMAQAIPAAQAAYGQGALRESLQDADLLLAVARSLLSERDQPAVLASAAQVQELRARCERADDTQKAPLFGKTIAFDFSQCKPRGHYDEETLRAYFRAMSWLGRVGMAIGGKQYEPRQLGAAVVLEDLLRRSGQAERMGEIDRLLRVFVGESDSTGFAELGALLSRPGQARAEGLDAAGLKSLWQAAERSQVAPRYGLQRDPEFRFLGQRFILDAWVSEEVTGERGAPDGTVMKRLLPTGLDVAYAALGNDAALPLLAPEITRHGALYQHQLTEARRRVDQGGAAPWSASLYGGWLHALRALSLPAAAPGLPGVMRSAQWSQRLLSAQLGSWAEARHDTILYAKQSGSFILCEYPAGFVEPVPLLWERLEQLARRAGRLIGESRFPEKQRAQQGYQVKFLDAFVQTMTRLKGIAQKELAQKPLAEDEARFLKDLIQIQRVPMGCTSEERFSGWYPGLFYKNPKGAGKAEPLVADVHTGNNNGAISVLHAAVGHADLLMVAVDSGKDQMVYAGPTFSYYEFVKSGSNRLNDSEWSTLLQSKQERPARPAWTQSYLVPAAAPRQ